ncbi:MAG: C-terminal binding protein [Streptosporangiales bacterium]|nr:C-terminal binding protein [Streptosporangiales bacterium]
MTRIVIADCDHGTVETERRAAAEAGVDIIQANCVTEDDVIRAAAGAAGVIVQYAPVTARVLDALPDLRVVSRYGVGVDTVDVGAAHARGVLVCNVPDYGTEDVSDHAIGLAVSVLRGIPRLDRGLRQGSADLNPVKPLHRFRGRVFGIVGLGRIGVATGVKARALGFEVVAHDPVVTAVPEELSGAGLLSLEDLLRRADVVSLHVPLNDATRHLIGARTLGLMKAGAIVVNTCRGGVIDTEALADALEDGRLLGAALDVTEPEPLPPSHRLYGLPNVVLTPHAGWYSEESFTELKQRAAGNAIDGALGKTPRNVVTPGK